MRPKKQNAEAVSYLLGDFLGALVLWATYNSARLGSWEHLTYWECSGIVLMFTFVVGVIRRPRG